MHDDGPMAEVERLLGVKPIALEEVALPWGSTTRTHLVTLADGERVILQSSPRRAGMRRRIWLGRLLPERAPIVPWASFLSGDARAAEPFLVTSFVPGIRGGELLDTDRHAAQIAAQMGHLLPALAAIPARGLGLSGRWADQERLEAASRRWLERGEPILGARTTTEVRRRIAELPELLAEAPTFAHGDFAPVNVLVDRARIVALLDLERARLAHPLFDAAWWRLMVRFHHPERWRVAGPAFFHAAGIPRTRRAIAQLDLLAVLGCLEMLGGAPRRSRSIGSAWADRVRAVMGWSSGGSEVGW